MTHDNISGDPETVYAFMSFIHDGLYVPVEEDHELYEKEEISSDEGFEEEIESED